MEEYKTPTIPLWELDALVWMNNLVDRIDLLRELEKKYEVKIECQQ